jgi:hypothetical protein
MFPYRQLKLSFYHSFFTNIIPQFRHCEFYFSNEWSKKSTIFMWIIPFSESWIWSREITYLG